MEWRAKPLICVFVELCFLFLELCCFRVFVVSAVYAFLLHLLSYTNKLISPYVRALWTVLVWTQTKVSEFVISDVHAPTEHSLVCVCSARCVCQQRKAWRCSWPRRHPTLLKWELLAFSISLRTSEWAIVIHCSVHCLSASLCTPLAGMVCSKMVCLFLDLKKNTSCQPHRVTSVTVFPHQVQCKSPKHR